MSSTYRILCLSHDPAVIAAGELGVGDGEIHSPADAEAVIRAGVDGHEACDLMIGRYSYPLVELGCPASFADGKRREASACRRIHGSTVWADVDWLRLLALAHAQPDGSPFRKAATGNAMGCFTRERLHRLRSQREDLACPPSPAPCECGRVPDPGVCQASHSRGLPAGGHCRCAHETEGDRG